MGTVLSSTCHSIRNIIVRAILRALCLVSPSLDNLIKRLHSSPGIPVPFPSTPYWAQPPSRIARHGAEEGAVLPDYADVVVIGSGITGASIVRTLLDHDAEAPVRGEGGPLRVVMVEARDACSGATGRNGGHITPPLYHDWNRLKEKHGIDVARKIIRFRLTHLPQLLAAAEEEGLSEESQSRGVETFDVFHDKGLYAMVKKKLDVYKRDLPMESTGYETVEGVDRIKNLQLSADTVGCLTTRAGAIHPYRLVTGILSRLLGSYSSTFHLFTHTPCTSIVPPEASSSTQLYTVITPKGMIRAPHVIHATNGWASHLLPGMRGKILPARGVMSAQIPRTGLGEARMADGSAKEGARAGAAGIGLGEQWSGSRSFVFSPGASMDMYDYLTQQPAPPGTSSPFGWSEGVGRSEDEKGGEEGEGKRGLKSRSDSSWVRIEASGEDEREEGGRGESEEAQQYYPAPAAELMLGGGFARNGAYMTELGNADDRTWNSATGQYLAGALGDYFTVEGGDDEEGKERKQEETVESMWSGILGISVDEMPWVGRIPGRVSGRAVSLQAGALGGGSVGRGSGRLAPPGEWIAAGYSGEGMVHAWMSGKALACMILGLDKGSGEGEKIGEGMDEMEDWFPEIFKVTEERWKRACLEDLFVDFWPRFGQRERK